MKGSMKIDKVGVLKFVISYFLLIHRIYHYSLVQYEFTSFEIVIETEINLVVVIIWTHDFYAGKLNNIFQELTLGKTCSCSGKKYLLVCSLSVLLYSRNFKLYVRTFWYANDSRFLEKFSNVHVKVSTFTREFTYSCFLLEFFFIILSRN